MSLPSEAFLRAQARRLIAYMGDKHRFRVRDASSLEGVAAMWDQSDWNTLRALAAREHEPGAPFGPEKESSAAPRLIDGRTFPLTWQGDRPDFEVSVNDWYRHSMALGATAATRRIWLQQHLVAQLERRGPGVFLNAFGGIVPWDLYEPMRKDGTLIELHEERPVARACGNVLNLMADMEPGEIASMLAPTLLPEANDDFWLQSTNYMLTVAVIALRAAKLPVTFSSLHALFVAGPARLVGLAKKLDPESEAGKVLTVFLDGVGANGEVIRDNSWSSQFSVMSHAFRRLAAREWVHTLFSDATGAQGLFSMLQQRKCIVIEGPERSSGQAEKTILSGLRSALSRRLQASREEGEQGWVFGFSEVDKYQSPALYRMVEQGRGARAAFLCTSEDARNLSPEIRANVWNQLHLRGVNPELLAKLTEMIATRPVLLQPHRVTMSNYWDA